VASDTAQPVKIPVGDMNVSGLLLRAVRAKACLVFAHGAGAGMHHPFLAAVACELAALRIATLRYQFPYMENGSKRPDSPQLCHATVRAAVSVASQLLFPLPLLAGGKSFGGRMTSQAQAAEPLPGVRGLVFVGFPLHAAKQPSDTRGEHLVSVRIPMLFLQGTRDALADLTLLGPLVKRIGRRATLRLIDDADHSFHVRARSGRNDAQARAEMVGALAGWTDKLTENC
jgi:uncharacterized protein